ncbi:MFS transporter [Kitasatospora kifunensis]|uniref:EmrB/QacA subfamily drug resistance transporter n=1 Tax=Kitasatospora kifunensis TaxID=58351 RepID=A0A7W7R6Q2_KITKI|nr:MFS transporter [Kitasatospora kifunensis]MBB4926330.1 EmrB/QacA subfamily drug resistance transporter [Kitasatospora kifunensis]
MPKKTPAPRASVAVPPRSNGRWWALAALTLSVLVVGLDSFILYTALPTLSASLHASTTQLQWIQAAYTLAWAGLLLPIGTLGDQVGRRRMVLGGLLIFGVSSVIASQVTTADALIAMRALMGAGAAVIMPMVLAILPSLFPDAATRRKAVSAVTVGAILGLSLGPLLAGWLLTSFSWGSVFLINGPVVLLSLIGVAILVPESKDPRATRLDWPGALLCAIGVMGVVYGIIEQPTYGWAGRTLLPLIGGLAFLVAFLLRQRRSVAPLVDLRLFANRTFTWGTIAFAVISFAQAGMLFVVSPFLQVVQGNDAQGTGLRLLPMIAALLCGAGISDAKAARFGAKLVIPAGMVVSAGGLAIFTVIHPGSGYGIVALALVVFGFGLGLGLPLAADTVLDALAPSQAGMGNALSRTMQSMGVSLGSAILGSVLNSAYRDRIDSAVAALPGGAQGAARSGVEGAHGVAAQLPVAAGRVLTQAADRAYLHGMGQAAVTTAVLLVVGAALVLRLLPKGHGGQGEQGGQGGHAVESEGGLAEVGLR